MSEREVLRSLRQSTALVQAAFFGLGERDLIHRPAEGEWNAWEIAYHLLDIERWYVAKLCEAATSSRTGALERFLAVWSRLREETIALAREIPEARLDQAGLLSGVPDWTPRGLLAAIAAHDHGHAAQVREARGGAVR